MCILFTSDNLSTIAQHHADRRLSFALTQATQILSNIHRRLTGRRGLINRNGVVVEYPLVLHHFGENNHEPVLYLIRTTNKPLEDWVMESLHNYRLLWFLWCELSSEYEFRFDRTHPSSSLRFSLRITPPGLPKVKSTRLPTSRHSDNVSVVESYKEEAINSLTLKERWTKRSMPSFLSSCKQL